MIDKICLHAIVAAHLDDGPGTLQQLEASIDEDPENSTSLYAAACTYSVLSGIYREKDIARAKVCSECALSLIRQAIEHGYADLGNLQTDADLDPLRNVKGFVDIMQSRSFTLRYAAVWNNSGLFESQQSHGLSTQDHFAKCQAMQANGFRIVSISTTAINGKSVTTLCFWHCH